MQAKVLINDVEKVKRFIKITNGANCDIDLLSGTHTFLDAKSLLGILSCDYTQPLTIDIHADEEESESIVESLSAFVIA